MALAAQLHVTPATLEEHLLAWRDAGLLEYRDGARDWRLELCPAPSDGKTLLPELLATLAERHERQIAALVAYTCATACRQTVIARHFGERLRVPVCGVCDTCQGTAAARPDNPTTAARVNRHPRPPRVRDTAVLRETILVCLRELPYAVGISGLARVLRGSADTAPSAARCAHFGALAGVSRARLRCEIEAMVAEGLLERDGAGEYPLLRVRA
jgi:ATP-dependent DNA helicase RecQ